jgi:hypothetical protein
MRFVDSSEERRRPSPLISHPAAEMLAVEDRQSSDKLDIEENTINTSDSTTPAHDADAPVGVAKVEAIQAVYGKYGKYCLWAGLAMMMIVLSVSLLSSDRLSD